MRGERKMGESFISHLKSIFGLIISFHYCRILLWAIHTFWSSLVHLLKNIHEERNWGCLIVQMHLNKSHWGFFNTFTYLFYTLCSKWNINKTIQFNMEDGYLHYDELEWYVFRIVLLGIVPYLSDVPILYKCVLEIH